MTRKFVRLNSTLFFKVEFTFTINLASFFDSEIFSLFYKICYNIKVIKEGYHEAKIFTDDDAISRN